MVKLVLFDIDGTLVLTGGAGMKAFARAFATEFGLLDGADKLHFAGRTDTSLVREFFLKHNITATEDHYRRFFDSYVFWLDHLVKELHGHVCPGALKFLEQMERVPEAPMIGLLTGNIQLGAEIKLRHFGLWERFHMGAFGNDHEERNELARIAMQRGGKLLKRKLKGEEVLVIGDTPLDIACGQAIGARVLAVATGNYTIDQLQEHRPTYVASTLGDIKASSVLS